MSIELSIDRLILDGMPVEAGGRDVLRAAAESEIGRLLAERDLTRTLALAGAGARPWLRGGIVEVEAGTSADELGRRIGQAVFHGLAASSTHSLQSDSPMPRSGR